MLRHTNSFAFFHIFTKIRRPSRIGYEITQLPDPRALRDFIEINDKKIVIAILAESPKCDVTENFMGLLHDVPLGSPKDVCLATMMSCGRHPEFAAHFNVLAYPTCLLFLNRKVQERVLGGRVKELSLKSRLLARREGLDVFSE